METVVSGGARLNCRLAGDLGSDLSALFIHGLNANLAFWHEELLSVLGRGRSLVLYDQRGHGYSDLTPSGYTTAGLAADAAFVLASQGIDRADIVAHSFGTVVALQLARLHPQRVRSLVLLDGRLRLFQPEMKLGEWSQFEKWRRHFTAAGIDLSPDLDLDFTLPLQFLGKDLSAVAKGLREDGFFVPSAGTRSAEKYRRLLTETTAARDFRDPAGLDLEALRRLHAPALLIYGDRSPFLPTLEGLERALPDSASEMIAGGGHNFPFLRPRDTAEAIGRFWASRAAAGAGAQATPGGSLRP